MNVYVGKVVQGQYSDNMYIVYEIHGENNIGCFNLTAGYKCTIYNFKHPERELSESEEEMFKACYQELMTRNIEMLKEKQSSSTSDGSSADYYKLPEGCTQLQDLISERDMNAQMGEIFRAAYRYGLASHSDKLRDAKKIKFYIEAEIVRLSKCGNT